MSAIHWKSDVSDNFDNAADWKGGVVPGASDNVILSAAGTTPYTVTVTDSHTVRSIQTNALATLDITSGSFTATKGTGSGTNFGTIDIDEAATLSVQGTIANSGGINLLGTGVALVSLVLDADTTLSGGGQVTLSDGARNVIYSSAAVTLTNVDNTISGAGILGDDGVTLVNSAAGVIDSTGTEDGLYISTGSNTITNLGLIEETGERQMEIRSPMTNTGTLLSTGVGGLSVFYGATTNTGLIEATGAGGFFGIDSTLTNDGTIQVTGSGRLLFEGGMVTNTGLIETTSPGGLTLGHSTLDNAGIIAPLSLLGLYDGEIASGSLTIEAGGTVNVFSFTYANALATATLTNQGELTVSNHSGLHVEGMIINSGGINLAATAFAAELCLDANTILSGNGQVTLSDRSGNNIYSNAAVTLTNVNNTISGSGTLGNGNMTLANQAAGILDASGANHPLFVNTGLNNITNAGLIEATSGGSAVIQSTIANTGTIEANGGNVTVNAAVIGTGSAVIAGGTLTFASAFNENVSFTGTAGQLVLAKSRTYTKSITGFSLTGGTSLDLKDIGFVSSTEATFKGTATSGTLTVADGTHTAHIKLTGDYLGSTFIASSDDSGGVSIVDPAKGEAALLSSPHRFITAMAGLGGQPPGGAVQARDPMPAHEQALFKPRAMIA